MSLSSVDLPAPLTPITHQRSRDRKSTRLNSSHLVISYAVFCLKKKNRHSSALRFSPSSRGLFRCLSCMKETRGFDQFPRLLDYHIFTLSLPVSYSLTELVQLFH